MDLLAVDRESAAKGDADAVDLAKVAVGGDFFVAVDIIYNDLAAFGVILHIQHGANYLAIRQGDFQFVAALAVNRSRAEDLQLLAFKQRVEEMPTSARVADKVEGFVPGHGGYGLGCVPIRARLMAIGVIAATLHGIELPGFGAVVGHNDTPSVGGKDDHLAVVGLFLESSKADRAVGELEGAFKADALELLPVLGAGEVLFVVIAQDTPKAIVEPGVVHRVQAHNGLTE